MMQLGLKIGPCSPLNRRAKRKITLASGAGYVGSVYTSTAAGQWFADGTAISGAVGSSFTMTTAHEGKALRCGASNTIAMWVPGDLAPALKTNGGWWGGVQTESAGKVLAWPDRLGLRDMTQTTASKQPSATLINGRPAAAWPMTANDYDLRPAANFAPAWWLIVMQLEDGTRTVWDGSYRSVMLSGAVPYRIMSAATGDGLITSGAWTTTLRKNAAASYGTAMLPLPMSLCEFRGTPTAALWSLGRGFGADPRGWRGPMMLAIACGEEPTDDALARLQSFAAHSCGLAASLPAEHPYKTLAPRKL